jgi:adenylate cyclase
MAREQRKLAAILAVDVVGYSRLMGRDESGTLARLREHRKLRLEPAIARYDGRLVKLMGDGALVEFASAVDALSAAIEVQQTVADINDLRGEAERIVFRVGLHLGDLIVDGDDLYGDGVNVAARLEAVAPAGGIVVSSHVHDAVVGRLKASFRELGALELKNIQRPVQSFQVAWNAADWQVSEMAEPIDTTMRQPLAIPDKPSIAVLPFQNMSGDAEQEYFADGIAEDILTALARFPSLFVIARNSSFTYKGKAVDIKRIGQELGARYVLEGSVRKAGGRVRINGQLIQADNGTHIWADRYDGDLSDIFALQDRITEAVAAAIAPSIERAELERAQRKPPTSLDAHDLYLRALSHFYAFTKEGSDAARTLLERALALDPDHGAAALLLAEVLGWRVAQGWSSAADVGAEAQKYLLLAERIDKHNPDILALQARGGAAYLEGRHEDAIALIQRALALNPNSAKAWSLGGWVYVYAGQPETAVAHLQRAMRLNPRDPLDFDTWVGLSQAFMQLERDGEALDAARQAAQRGPTYLGSWRVLAASLALTGKLKEAHTAVATLRRLEPNISLKDLRSLRAWTETARARYFEGLRLAGLPE